MKKVAVLSSLLLMMLLACNREPVNPVVGAWDMIYAKQVQNDSVVATFPGTYQGSQVKMWCNNYWMFVGQFSQDTVTADGFGGGSYTLEGIVYKETIKYHSSESNIGKTLRMRIVVANDTLIQVWPADEMGEVDKSNYTSEKYVRVK
ncbi:MAG: hypothetical protein R2758_00825 [Bacteroidales bacterium]|nr:MAG: hypothetical protein EP313_08010 [Bacteroidota bacterium]